MADENETVGSTIKVNLDDAVRKLAQQQNVDPRQLQQPIDITRYNYLRATVISYYQGWDEGYLAALVAESSLRRRSLILLFTAFTLMLGAMVTLFVAWFRSA